MVSLSIRPVLVLVVAVAVSAPLLAQQGDGRPDEAHSDWDITLGAGAVLSPVYEGSSNYQVIPLPFFRIQYKDRVELGVSGLTVDAYKSENLTLGVGANFDGGREEDGSSLFSSANDDRLLGLGDIGNSLAASLYAEYDFGPLDFNAKITRFVGSDNDGVLAEVSIDQRVSFSRKFNISPALSATWADSEYMQTFFGVTLEQSQNSSFEPFAASAGLKDIGFSLTAIYLFNEHWLLFSSAQIKRLLTDAANSPISQSETQLSFVSAVAYRF